MGMIEDVQAQMDAAESAKSAESQSKTDPPPTPENAGENAKSETTPAGVEVKVDETATETALASTAAAQQSAAGGWDKALQAQQQETALLGRKLDQLVSAIQQQGGQATAAQVEQAQAMKDRLTELDTMLAGDFDGFEQTKPALKAVTEELRDTKKQLAAINKKLEVRDAQDQAAAAQQNYAARVNEFWSDKPTESRQAFVAKTQELEKRGYQGERLQGALDAWWEGYQPPAKTDPSADTSTKKDPPVTKTAPSRPAGTTPGGARVVPPNTGVRPPPQAKSPEEIIASGEVDFFGGRFDRR